VIDGQGKRLRSYVIETNGQALVEFLKMQPGTLHVCLEEGTQSGWLSEVLTPHAARVVVTHVAESRGQKSDEHDAFGLADRLRTGAIQTTVYKSVGAFATLRQLVKAHAVIVRDTVRVQMRIKALFRSRGVQVAGKSIYRPDGREEYLQALPPSSRAAAHLLFAQYGPSHTRPGGEGAHRGVASARDHQVPRELSGRGRDPRRAARCPERRGSSGRSSP
jgi:hypothetical protein